MRLTRRLVCDDAGQDLIEYALLVAFIGLACWAVIVIVGMALTARYTKFADVLASAS